MPQPGKRQHAITALAGTVALISAVASFVHAQAQTATPPRVTAWTVASGDQRTVVAIVDGLAKQRPTGVVTWKNGASELGKAPINPLATSLGVGTIAAGGGHTCVIDTTTGVKCWGMNDKGQLGNGTKTESATPVAVKVTVAAGTADLTGVLAIAAGESHTCALLVAGGVKCWGKNEQNQLGDKTTTDRDTAVDVSLGTAKVIGIAAGGRHACALISDGTVKCWGYVGQGTGTDGKFATSTSDPVDISIAGTGTTTSPLSGVVQIAAGARHSCALQLAGTLYCWGYNIKGELGDGSKSTVFNVNATQAALKSRTPSAFRDDLVAVAAGQRQTCALTRKGDVTCWGANEGPEGGGNDGSGSKIAVTDVFGWGVGNDYTLADRTINWFGGVLPPFDADDVVVALAAGHGSFGSSGNKVGFHMCALTSRGEVRCFGDNRKSQAGAGKVAVVANAVDVAAGGDHTCAVLGDGSVACWGDNSSKQLGVATPTTSATPVTVAGVTAVVRARAMLDVTTAPTTLTAAFAAQ